MPIEMAVYLLKYDSVYGDFPQEVRFENDTLIVGDKRIRYSSFEDNKQNQFNEADIVLECSGHYRSAAQNAHYLQHNTRVIISAPTKDDTPTYIYGANHHNYHHEAIISASSCTANATAPLIKALDTRFGVSKGTITVIHAYTSDQSLLDGQHKAQGRRGRGSGMNMLPLFSSVASEVEGLYPHIPLVGINIRVPVDNAMMLVLNLEMKDVLNNEEVHHFLNTLNNEVLCYETTPLVSSDIKYYKQSAVIDAQQCSVHANMLSITLFQDNERAYASRLLDLAKHMFLC